MAKRIVKSEPAPTGPTRQSIDNLFRELLPSNRYEREEVTDNDPDYIAAVAAVEEREKELEKDVKLKELKAAVKEARRKAQVRAATVNQTALKVYREYQAKGLTDEVAAKIAKLVDQVNKA